LEIFLQYSLSQALITKSSFRNGFVYLMCAFRSDIVGSLTSGLLLSNYLCRRAR